MTFTGLINNTKTLLGSVVTQPILMAPATLMSALMFSYQHHKFHKETQQVLEAKIIV